MVSSGVSFYNANQGKVTIDRVKQIIYFKVSRFDEGLRHQWPLPSTEIRFWHITAQMNDLLLQSLKL